MKSSYKTLGKYIKPIDERNSSLEELPLMGLSVSKQFFPTIANLVGTDMKTYKVVYRNQFTYIADTSRRGDKIAIALNDVFDKMLVSQAYTPFEVIDPNQLDPEYLMMWFRRPEFDRYARFKSHGSAREIFDWEEMCNVTLPIPHITKQREIVKEYNTIQNRIDLNQKLIKKLEETAQAIYKQWFVEFEFPDENGKPYKSNGGDMIWCEDLGKDIPKGWEAVFLDRVCDKQYGYPFDSSLFTEESSNTPLVRIRDIISGYSEVYTSENVEAKYLLQDGDLLVGMDGTFHMSIWHSGRAYLNQRVVRFRTLTDELTNLQVLYSIRQQILDFENNIQGTTVAHLSDKDIKDVVFLKGDMRIQKKFSEMFSLKLKTLIILNQQKRKLSELKELLLSKLATYGV